MPTYDGSGFDSSRVLKLGYDEYEKEWERMTPSERDERSRRIREGFEIVMLYCSGTRGVY